MAHPSCAAACADPSARAMSVDELFAAVQRAQQQQQGHQGQGPRGAHSQVTKAQLLAMLRTMDDILTYDERTGVVRPRVAGGSAGVPPRGADAASADAMDAAPAPVAAV
eukprot:363888-Chlamydomonas_euryale.AAC.17